MCLVGPPGSVISRAQLGKRTLGLSFRCYIGMVVQNIKDYQATSQRRYRLSSMSAHYARLFISGLPTGKFATWHTWARLERLEPLVTGEGVPLSLRPLAPVFCQTLMILNMIHTTRFTSGVHRDHREPF